MKILITSACLLMLSIYELFSQNVEFTEYAGWYLGQDPPGIVPKKFPSDFLPSGYRLHSAPAFTPNGKELYFSAMDFSIGFSEKIFVIKMKNGRWTLPEIASFSGSFFDGSPVVSRDGKYLFFSSARSPDQTGMKETTERNIWYVERNGMEWSKPVPLGGKNPVMGNGSDISIAGNYYFNSAGDISKTTIGPEGALVEKLGTQINSSYTELHPCIAPDERFLIFYSSRPGHYGSGGGDLYISFKDDKDEWKPAKNLGATFNKGHLSTSFPRLSPDGKYFFFLKLIAVPWQCELYWVSVDALDEINY